MENSQVTPISSSIFVNALRNIFMGITLRLDWSSPIPVSTGLCKIFLQVSSWGWRSLYNLPKAEVFPSYCSSHAQKNKVEASMLLVWDCDKKDSKEHKTWEEIEEKKNNIIF